MIFRLSIDLNNAAFYDEDGEFHPEPEIMRMLNEVSDKLEAKEPGATMNRVIYDINGNGVGSFRLAVERM